MSQTQNTNQYKINFNQYAEKVDGEINSEATIAKFTRELNAHVELQTKDQPALLAALESIYEGLDSSATMQKPSVLTMVLSKVGFTNDTFASLKERAEIVIDSNPRYYTVKGKGGGLRRMSDSELETFESSGKTPDVIAREAKEAEKAKGKSAAK